MEENIRLVDLVIELVDARIPMSSRNPDIDALCRGKGRVVLLCKADLADPVRTEEFLEFFRNKGFLAVAADARERKAGELVRRFVQDACKEKLERDRARGIVGRPLRAMVAGIPNVGKSTFINSFAGRASTKTGNKPGVTRGKQWIRMGNSVELLDTPGILWPKFDDQTIGMRLALAGAIRDEVLDRQELALWLLQYLEQEYPGAVRDKYLNGDLPAEDPQRKELPAEDPQSGEIHAEDLLSREIHAEVSWHDLLLEIARARKLLRRGGEPDAERAAAMLVDDCRNGRIGRISLDRPCDAEAMMENQTASARETAQEKRKAGKGKSWTKGSGRPGENAGDQSRRPAGKADRPGGNAGDQSRRPAGKAGRPAGDSPGRSRRSPGQSGGSDRFRTRGRNSGRQK